MRVRISSAATHATRYGTLGRGGEVRLVKADDLDMSHGGVNRVDKKLDDESYLTEMLQPGDTNGVILPMSRLRTCWDVLIFLFVAYTAIILPIVLCFDEVSETFPSSYVAFEMFNDVAFIFDIFLNFRTAYVHANGSLVVDRATIRRTYLKKWFAIDVIGSFPGDSIFFFVALAGGAGIGNEGSFATLVKLLKVPKLMRLGRLLKALDKIEGAGNVAGIVILCICMVTIVHWVTCVFYAFTKGDAGWVNSQGLAGSNWTDQYWPTFYSTLMMVMGDSVEPTNSGEFAFASLVVVMGVTVNATIFASIQSYTALLSSESSAHKNKMNSINNSIHSLQLKGGLPERSCRAPWPRAG